MGIEGITLASFLTNLLVLILNIWLTNATNFLEIANRISIFDLRVYKNLKTYLSIGIPCVMILVLDWSCFEVSSLMAGYIGVNELAANILLLNL